MSFEDPEKETSLPTTPMPSPGAVWPSMVTFRATLTADFSTMDPPTPKSTIRCGRLTASRNEPGPASLRLVTT